MTIRVKWYERNDDFTPDYNKAHSGTISGKDANEVWRKFTEYGHNHDLAKYTPREIVGMWE